MDLYLGHDGPHGPVEALAVEGALGVSPHPVVDITGGAPPRAHGARRAQGARAHRALGPVL